MTDALGISDAELLAWLDEDLTPARMSTIEQALRSGRDLQQRVAGLIAERDHGALTVGEVWRRHRLSCPGLHELGSYLLQALEPGLRDYIQFHLETVGCTKCLATLEDLRLSSAASAETIERRQRIFASSVHRLKESPRPQ